LTASPLLFFRGVAKNRMGQLGESGHFLLFEGRQPLPKILAFRLSSVFLSLPLILNEAKKCRKKKFSEIESQISSASQLSSNSLLPVFLSCSSRFCGAVITVSGDLVLIEFVCTKNIRTYHRK